MAVLQQIDEREKKTGEGWRVSYKQGKTERKASHSQIDQIRQRHNICDFNMQKQANRTYAFLSLHGYRTSTMWVTAFGAEISPCLLVLMGILFKWDVPA